MKLGHAYLASHFVARNRNEEEVSLKRIGSEETAFFDVLEEITFAGIFPGELPRRVEIGLRITVRVHEHLQLLLHLLVVQFECLRRVEHSRRMQRYSARRIEIALCITERRDKKVKKSKR